MRFKVIKLGNQAEVTDVTIVVFPRGQDANVMLNDPQKVTGWSATWAVPNAVVQHDPVESTRHDHLFPSSDLAFFAAVANVTAFYSQQQNEAVGVRVAD